MTVRDLTKQSGCARLNQQEAGMGLVSFEDAEGGCWRVWKVDMPAARAHLMDANFRSGWLVFEREDETERRRLSQVPDDWASYPPERMRTLLDAAVLVTTPRSGTT